MRINHNIAALNTYSRLASATGAQGKSLEKLSSGQRINKAGDDAAGLAISEKMRSQIRGLDQASRNAQDGISMIQTAEGALNETHSILQRMRELAVQASNATYTDADRGEIQKEVNQLSGEINRIAGTTEFNKQTLLDGGMAAGSVKGASAAVTKAGTDGVQAVFEYTFNCVIACTECNFSLCGVTFFDNACSWCGSACLGASVSYLANKINEYFCGTWEATAVGNKLTVKQVLGNYSCTAACGLCLGASCAFLNCMTGTVVNQGVSACAQVQRLTFTDASIKEGVIIAIGTCSVGLWNSNAGTYACATEARIALGVDCVFDIACVNSVVICAKNFVCGLTACTSLIGAGVTVACIDVGILEVTTTTASTVAARETVAKITAGAGTALASSAGVQLQIGANTGQSLTAAFGDMTGTGLKITAMASGQSLTTSNGTVAYFRTTSEVESNGVTNQFALDVSTTANASAAITAIDDAVTAVSAERSKMGAYQNRLEHTINNLNTSSENLTAAESRIRDVDMAKEMMEFTKNNILNQAATAMLAQANQQPQGVLQLLR